LIFWQALTYISKLFQLENNQGNWQQSSYGTQRTTVFTNIFSTLLRCIVYASLKSWYNSKRYVSIWGIIYYTIYKICCFSNV